MKTIKNQEQWIREIGHEVTEILVKKNNDYGDAFAKRYQKHGFLSALIRMEDKWLRLENLSSGHKAEVDNEGLKDTVMDLVGYGILTLIEMSKEESHE